MSSPLLVVDDLRVTYTVRDRGRRRALRAVDGVDLIVEAGESVAIVGESGCGKSSLARALVGLERHGGRIVVDGLAVGSRRSGAERRAIQMVFQDPALSLNPRRTVGSVLVELLRVHGLVERSQLRARAGELLEMVNLPLSALEAYPRQLSGGQRQRVGIARALALEPRVLIADEPVSALDVSVQASILTLLADLRDRLGVAIIFISHDLGVVRHLCERTAVMYLGRVVEDGPTDRLFDAPIHPYTRALLDAAPSLLRRRVPGQGALSGEPASPLDVPKGCRFRSRCPAAVPACAASEPVLTRRDPRVDHAAACIVPLPVPTTRTEGSCLPSPAPSPVATAPDSNSGPSTRRSASRSLGST